MRSVALRKPLLHLLLTAILVTVCFDSHAQNFNDANRKYRVVDGMLKEFVPPADSAIADSLRPKSDSLITVLPATLDNKKAKTDTAKKVRVNILRDSIPLSRMAWMSAVLPGYGQLYNKQAWKIPIIYAIGGTSLYFTIKEHHKYKEYKNQYNRLIYESAPRGVLDQVQGKMIQHNTRKQLFMMALIGTYIYSVGDAALNYRWQSSAVKKATTLSTILPGAGQFFNKSYWKVPIVLGGVATMAFVIDWNNRGYNRFKTAYDLRYSAQQNNTESKDEFVGILDLDGIREWKNNYRRNRDLCIIIAGGLYILNIIEAHVDASLRDYDISDHLAMELEPRIMPYSTYAASGNSLGFGLNFRF